MIENEKGDLQASNGAANNEMQKPEQDAATTQEPASANAPYCILPEREKVFFMIICSIAGMISPMSSSIYFPALDNIGADLGVSTTLMNLTITMYLVCDNLSDSVRTVRIHNMLTLTK